MSEEALESQVDGDLETEQPEQPEEVVEETAPPSGEDAPEGTEEPEKKGRFQKRIDELVREREEAKEEAANWRGEVQRIVRESQRTEPQKIEVDMSDVPVPKRDAFEDEDEYQSAVAERAAIKAYRTERARDVQQQQIQSQSAQETKLFEWQAAGRAKYPDFDIALGGNVPISQTMADTIMANDYGHEVAYRLGKNPQEAVRIAGMLPMEQKFEILKLAKDESKRKKPKTETTAPSPTSPVGDREVVATKKWKITDPDIPFKEYEKLRMAEKRRQMGLA